MRAQYARLGWRCQQAFLFRRAESRRAVACHPASKGDQMRGWKEAHNAGASNESLWSMNPAQKALWFIERPLANELTLDEIAGVGEVSRYHMVRAFAAASGLSVMRYVRARRLSEAARALADGAPNILSVALDADYGSHEAFTRAFRERFGLTPDAARTQGIDVLKL